MVFDPDNMKDGKWVDASGKEHTVDASAGHVAYVEDVSIERINGKILYKVTISQANTLYDQDGKPIWHRYAKAENETFYLTPDTLSDLNGGIWFLYGKINPSQSKK